MKIGLIDIDGHNFPNLALMKLAAWHKVNGDTVAMTTPEDAGDFDWGYASKVFSFTPMPELPGSFEIGGAGVNLSKSLPEEIEHLCPDYELYGLDYSLGFLTRGCVRKCPWCVVPLSGNPDKGTYQKNKVIRNKRPMCLNHIVSTE